MKISELLQESQQLDELTAADIGKGVGKVAKGVGAVAGGVAGIPGAVKKGFQAGKQAVAGAGDEPQATDQNQTPADPAAQKPAAKPGIVGKLKQAASDFKQGFQQGSGKPQAQAQEKPAAADSNDSEVNTLKQQLVSLKKEISDLRQQINIISKVDDNPNIVRSNTESVSESIQLFKK